MEPNINKIEPDILQKTHITSNLITEPKLQIRYTGGQLDNKSKDEIYSILMTGNINTLDNIVKVSWNNNRRRFIGRIIKGEDMYLEINIKYNINPNDYYILIQNFTFNQFRAPMKYNRLYCQIGDNCLIEIINIYKL